MRSMTSPRAVSMTIGTRLDSRTLRQTLKPSMSGSITSRMTRSGGSRFSARRPFSGSATAWTTKPNWPRYSVSSAVSRSSSSMISTRVPADERVVMSGEASFRAQRANRRQPRGGARRPGAEAEADDEHHAERGDQRVDRRDDGPVRGERDGERSGGGDRNADDPAAEREQGRFEQELDQHV